MGKTEPRTLPGFMELLPSEQILFDDMKQKIEKSYQKFGLDERSHQEKSA